MLLVGLISAAGIPSFLADVKAGLAFEQAAISLAYDWVIVDEQDG
jgi:hypothetical protein